MRYRPGSMEGQIEYCDQAISSEATTTLVTDAGEA
jgi:hypothetical protein